MIRERVKSQIADRSTVGKAVVVALSVVAMAIGRRGAFALEGAGEIAIVLVGLPVLLLFFGGAYVGAMALIGIYHDTRGDPGSENSSS